MGTIWIWTNLESLPLLGSYNTRWWVYHIGNTRVLEMSVILKIAIVRRADLYPNHIFYNNGISIST